MNDPTPNAAVLAYLSDRLRHGENGQTFWTDDAGLVILDTDKPGCPPADAKAVAAWTRHHVPNLWATETSTATPATPPSTAADVMALARSGTISPSEAAARLLAARPTETAPTPARPAAAPRGELNFTTLMSKARTGDGAALAALQTMVRTTR